MHFPLLVELVCQEQGKFLDLRTRRNDLLPPVVGGTRRSACSHGHGEAEAGKYRVVEITVRRVAELLPAQGREAGHRAKGLGDVDLAGVVVFTGAQALVFIGSGEFDLADQVQHQATVTAVEQGVTGAGNRVSQPAFHIPAATGQGVTIRAHFRVGDAQPGHSDLVGHWAGFILADHGDVPDFRGCTRAIVAT
ncbi:hypothetical protein PPS11_09569 [Pseudomonas putida S11]|nr:hypothetical protein PPS11_09569 [Pseudomonas putida S11]